MDDLLSEKEQLEQFRGWWSEYGAYVIGGIVIGAGLLFGISQYIGCCLASYWLLLLFVSHACTMIDIGH